MLTIKDVLNRVEEVRAAANTGDGEQAHTLEDELHVDVLQEIAGRVPGLFADQDREIQRMAAVALETRKIVFPRWTA